MGILFFINALGLGTGLAMDAFTMSVADALSEPSMSRKKRCLISASYAFFQFLMPLTGWFLVKHFVERFEAFSPFIPWIAFILLTVIGLKMIREALGGKEDESKAASLSAAVILMQDIATSIDALSVGFTISSYGAVEAFICALIIGAVTFAITLSGFFLGDRIAGPLGKKAPVVGGLILIAIGLEILIL